MEKGQVGKGILDFLYPFIGYFGVFVLVSIMLFLSYRIFFPNNFFSLLMILRGIYRNILLSLKTFFDNQKSSKLQEAFSKPSKKDEEEIFEPTSMSILTSKTKENLDVDFDESSIKVSYTPAFNKNLEEKKYADMVRLVNDDEGAEVREVNVERILERNKKIFEELNVKHFEEPPILKSREQNQDNTLKQVVNDFSLNLLKKQNIPSEEKNTFICLNEGSLKQEENILPSKDISFESAEENILGLQDGVEENKKFISHSKTNPFQKPLIVKELAENKQLLEELEFGEVEKPKDYRLPDVSLLQVVKSQLIQVDENEIDQKIQDLLSKLKMFKIEGDIARTYSGPIVTTFEFRPAPSVKVSRILTLGDDLAMALRAQSIRIQAPIPGKDVVGIEIPNAKTDIIYLREIFESDLFKNSASPLTLALGKDIVGNPFITDLKKLPHLLIAGTTGSGKSVGVNAMILSLLFRNSPDNLKLIMIDPKMVEFSMYADIPHLLTPIITNPKKAISALSSAVNEMERRYKIMSECKTKNIDKYNPKAKLEGFEVFPFLVIIIDELADLMMTGGKEAEFPIARIAQMGRAAGLHLIVATQRPSVDVVTGLIKTNLPSRISFKVGSKIDSRVVLDAEGAQSLLGRGDMLFTPPGIGGVVRLHAPWASEEEIEEIVEFIKSQREVEYDKTFLLDEAEVSLPTISFEGGGELIDEAKRIILQDKKTSISYLQRKLGVGYNKAASIIEELEKQGFLSTPNSKGLREILY
ncbi:DNA translocase FtsK [Helicobacter sp. 13S00477-4]|uniref:DNA translocase FtsK n=1 Tax=Helicobacter sp. 13S00477-4 TaxID=1905759 RepID=UPI002150AE44|nr:DNA translocase FtsK [Helicobacter sp. 13S00477-4]